MVNQPEHELYCDEDHLPRQQCNDALTPPGVRAALLERVAREAAEADVPAAVDPVEVEEPASSALREAVTETEMPQPTVYVSREWQRTEAAIGGQRVPDVDFNERRSGSGTRRTIMALVAIAVVLFTVRRVRGRHGERR